MKKERNKSDSGAKGNSCRVIAGKEGLIIAHHGISVEVLSVDGLRSMVRVKRNSGHVVGDRVNISGEVLHRLDRRTELRRRDARGGVHLVGANLDMLGIVVAPLPVPAPGFVDRAIVAARAADLLPFVVVNKCDLVGSAELVTSLTNAYAGVIPVFPVSTVEGHGLESILKFLKGHRGAFVGITGVGKSSLLNALCPGIELKTGELGEVTNRGCHTTTVSTLHSLEGGGELIDTPGFQDFGLVDISAEELAAHFPGFERTDEATCRFRNCRHRTEPGCAVVDLVSKGLVSRQRYETYLSMLTEVEAAEAEAREKEWKK
jgi:ribosome biogenesis GTPase / thiamine phosphate phosphatase